MSEHDSDFFKGLFVRPTVSILLSYKKEKQQILTEKLKSADIWYYCLKG